MKKIQYLRTVTSLRGVSVLGVLLYHSKYNLFQGGYLGVDVFFVISGFLIGNIIFSDQINSQFNFKKFYIRRLRRLMPTLIFTIFLTFIISYTIFLPEDYQVFKNSVPYTLLFAGNIYFWRTNDYFSPTTDIMPLSHLWSLAVEEQFYLLFPIFIYLLFKNNFLRKYVKYIIFIGVVLSFIYTVSEFYNLPFDCPTNDCIRITNFYWLHTRAWEILVGVILNFIKINNYYLASNIFFNIGLASVVLSFMLNSSNLSHPGISTLPVIFGTSFIILSSLSNDTNILSSSTLLYFLGKISYSLYLIHFPLFVVKNYFGFKLNIYQHIDVLPILLILLSICISYFMWKYIEIPFRDFKFITNKNFIIVILVSTLLLLIISTSSLIMDKKLNIEYKKFDFTTDFSTKRECFFEKVPDEIIVIDQCIMPTKDQENILILGSSTAQNIYTGLVNLNQESINFDVVIVTGCPPLIESFDFDIIDINEKDCETLYKQINENLNEKNYSKIILSYQWHALIARDLTNEHTLFDYTLDNILYKIPREKLLIIGQPVRWESRLSVFALRELNFRKKIDEYTRSNLSPGIFSAEEIFNKKITEINVDSFSLIQYFCKGGECLTHQKDDGLLYFISPDFIHITDYFAKKIGIEIFKILDY